MLRRSVAGIRPPRRRCQHLQTDRTGAVEAGQDGGSDGCERTPGVYRQANVSTVWHWQSAVLTGTSKDIEKQIQSIQENSEKIKGEVSQSMAVAKTRTLTRGLDHPDSSFGPAVASRSSVIRFLFARKDNKIPNSYGLLRSCRLRCVAVKGSSQDFS